MASRLVIAADAAYPFDYTRLPPAVSVVLGYVGESGCTPHIWSTGEVAEVRTTGRTWGPIIVPPQRALTGADGTHAAQTMIGTLPQYRYPAGAPVFLDIERASFDAAPAGAAAAVRAWRAGMSGAGWPDAFVYWPGQGPFTWRPDWTGKAPRRLPAGVAGVQYAGRVDGGRYDLSAFAPSVFAGLKIRGGTMSGAGLSKDDRAWLVAQLGTLQGNIDAHLQAIKAGAGGKWHYATNLDSIMRAITADQPGPAGRPATPVDVDTLAGALVDKVGPRLAADLVAALAAKLS